jgi:hypothetical protein
MEYIQIDNFNGSINIIYKDDGSGEPLIFESRKEAETTLEENCQDGIIVPLSDSFKLLKRINELFDSDKILIEEETTEDRKNYLQLKKDLKDIIN